MKEESRKLKMKLAVSTGELLKNTWVKTLGFPPSLFKNKFLNSKKVKSLLSLPLFWNYEYFFS